MALIFQTHNTNIVAYGKKWGKHNLRFLNFIHPNFYLLLIQIFSLTPFATFLTVLFKVVSYPFKNIAGFRPRTGDNQ
jgi:hypothetical protein